MTKCEIHAPLIVSGTIKSSTAFRFYTELIETRVSKFTHESLL